MFCRSSVAARGRRRFSTDRGELGLHSFPSPNFYPLSPPLLPTLFQPQCTSGVGWGGSCLPTPWDWPGIKVIEPRGGGRHAGEKRRKKQTFASAKPRAYGLAGGTQLLSSHPAHHATADTSCSGGGVMFGRILHAAVVYLFAVTQAPGP